MPTYECNEHQFIENLRRLLDSHIRVILNRAMIQYDDSRYSLSFIPDEVFKKAGAFVLDLHSSDGKYGYQRKGFKLTMSAVGMFSLQLLGQEIMGPIVGGSGFNGGGGGGQKNNDALYTDLIEKSSVTLTQNLPEDTLNKGTGRPFYYWYYGTFAMRIIGGNSWAKWKSSVHNTLLPMQVKDGSDNDGSWNPK